MDLIGSIIIFLTIVVIAIALLAEPFSKTVNHSIVVFVITLAIFLLFVSNSSSRSREHYANNSISNTLDVLAAFGNQTGGESISKFSNGLTIYYSAFTSASYQKGSKTWVNVAPNQNRQSCEGVDQATHATFSETPSFTKENGFPLGRNVIRGPMSFKLGMSLNNAFTIAFTIRFEPFSATLPDTNLEIFKMYANTPGLNGLSLMIKNDYAKINDVSNYSVNMFLAFGNLPPVKVEQLSTLNTSNIYLFVITKTGLNLTLQFFPQVIEMTSDINTGYVGVNMQIPLTEDVMLSNKEFTINGAANLQASLYNFAIWNKTLTSTTLNALYKNTQIALQSGNQTLTDLAIAYAEMQEQLKNANACPYDEPTCATCSQVKNWSNINELILNGGSSCMNAIDSFCATNPTHPHCTCWNSSSALSDTEQCKIYKKIYKGEPQLSVDDAKSKYNLCDCNGGAGGAATAAVPKAAGVAAVPKALAMVSPPLVPRIMNTLYSINQDDIAAYEKIKIVKENINTRV